MQPGFPAQGENFNLNLNSTFVNGVRWQGSISALFLDTRKHHIMIGI
jgi:hypothetical protein